MSTNKTHDDNQLFDAFADMEEDTFDHVNVANLKKPASRKREESDRAETLFSESCGKCSGSGRIPVYGHIQAGVCFACQGKGVRLFKQPKAKRDAARIKAAERKERKMDENVTNFEDAWPQIKAWWTGSTFEFALNMREAVRRYGDLTEGQMNATLRCIEKFNAAKAARALQNVELEERRKDATPVDISHIVSAFANAKAKNIRSPKLRLLGEDHKLEFSRAPDHGKNPGAVYIKEGEEYLGKIYAGKFEPSRGCSTELQAAVYAACTDPEQAAIAYGRRFGVCSCCGRELTNHESIDLGIGPICREKYFR